MHEISICESILRTIESEFAEEDIQQIKEIHVKIGVLSCVEPELLKHVFKFIIEGTAFEETQLFTELTAVQAQCAHCGNAFKVEKYSFICPVCQSPVSDIREGNELIIHRIVSHKKAYEKINE